MGPTTLQIETDHPAFAGHFPGQPVLPGVALLAQVLEAAWADPALAARLGATPRIASVKFLAPVLPGATLTLAFSGECGAVRFEVREGARLAAAGAFEAEA